MTKRQSYTLRNYHVICNVVLFGTYIIIAAIAILLWINLSLNYNPQTLGQLVVCAATFLYTLFTHMLLRLGYHHTVAYLLLFFYLLIATSIVWSWGVNIPIAALIFGLVIVLAGILLTARHSLYAAITASTLLMGVQTAVTLNWHKPDTSWANAQACFSDVLAFSIGFGMLALVSWLYNHEMESSLLQAKQAEAALLQQKATLKMQVKKRTEQLRQAQLEEMQQMYRFAELGQLGVTMLHDLANHLTALTLEIEDLQRKQHSKAIERAVEITHYLESVVHSTRDRLHGGTQTHTFNIIRTTSEVLNFLKHKAVKVNVIIDWQPPAHSWRFTGDPASLSQIIAIITSNAIDAYGPAPDSGASERRVLVTMQRSDSDITIRIRDWGKGMTAAQRKALFKPFESNKKAGLGLGLYIAKQTVEMQFGGSIIISPPGDHTEFIIKLPLHHVA